MRLYRFARWSGTSCCGRPGVVATGNGDAPAGGLSPRVPVGPAPGVAYLAVGGIVMVELDEAVTDLTVPLRPGADGRAYLADTPGDGMAALPLGCGVVGAVISAQLV